MTAPGRVRRAMPPETAAMLRTARLRAGLGLREAARRAGISHGHMAALEGAARCPSTVTASALAQALALTDAECEQLAAAAVDDAGRSNPLRSATARG
jgi:transcriptional regulator with XRE-family HTH domain